MLKLDGKGTPSGLSFLVPSDLHFTDRAQKDRRLTCLLCDEYAV